MPADELTRGSSGEERGARAWAMRRIEALSGAGKYRELYEHWRSEIAPDSPRKMNEILRLLEVRLAMRSASGEVSAWPPRLAGDVPLVMIANHPFGIADGIVLAALAELLERPYKVLINKEFERIDVFRDHCLAIDFSGTRAAMAINLATRRQALEDLRNGVTLLAFPAGTVATAPRVFGRAQEVPWKTFTAGLVHKARASVLPVFFEGQNSLLFHAASHISAAARLSLLIAEFRRFPRRTMALRIGDLVPFDRLAGHGDRQALTDALYLAVHRMAPWAQGLPDAQLLPPQWMRERPYRWDLPLGRG